ncbi:hypothetical protein F0562_007982 [Nyssa sinensis]|uniref:Thioredoxin domain-containing protein n=1 Tax=Nyssa sinensis TaxID=561372 RepID=A0A5J5A7B4_9ASTE|nr:hypothetical protein F0562_007982 [Nyssa sinensis]
MSSILLLLALLLLSFEASSSSSVSDGSRSILRAVNNNNNNGDQPDFVIDLNVTNFDAVLRDTPATYAIVEFFAHWPYSVSGCIGPPVIDNHWLSMVVNN